MESSETSHPQCCSWSCWRQKATITQGTLETILLLGALFLGPANLSHTLDLEVRASAARKVSKRQCNDTFRGQFTASAGQHIVAFQGQQCRSWVRSIPIVRILFSMFSLCALMPPEQISIIESNHCVKYFLKTFFWVDCCQVY